MKKYIIGILLLGILFFGCTGSQQGSDYPVAYYRSCWGDNMRLHIVNPDTGRATEADTHVYPIGPPNMTIQVVISIDKELKTNMDGTLNISNATIINFTFPSGCMTDPTVQFDSFGNTTYYLVTTNKTKEDAFFAEHKNFYLANQLETSYVGAGQGDITGTREVPTGEISRGLFYSYGYIHPQSYPIDDKLTFNFTINTQYPTVLMNESGFINKSKELGIQVVRCAELNDTHFNYAYGHPYSVACMFEKEGTHFATEIDSITDTFPADKVVLNVYWYIMWYDDYPQDEGMVVMSK